MEIDISGGTIFLLDYPKDQFTILLEETPWQQRNLVMWGKSIREPRLTAWYGDAPYSYSGVAVSPLPWTNTLREIRTDIETMLGHGFNSMLYRN